jgi:hypothetical protein
MKSSEVINQPIDQSEESKQIEVVNDFVQEDNGKYFDESILFTAAKYSYDDDGTIPTEYYSSKKFEDFILSKGFLILEYFIQSKLCSFILLQLPFISETVMVSINRSKYPIDVTNSFYKKTSIEKIKMDPIFEERNDYDNITLEGFDMNHQLDVIVDTNVKQKSLVYYLQRQIKRLMYITKNIEIKPCILLDHLLGFHDMYHVIDRVPTKEFYPVISLETLFSKTFILEQNLPVFYKKFYQIVNQSNINKMSSLENSLLTIVNDIKKIKSKIHTYSELEFDKKRIKEILFKLKDKEDSILIERNTPQPVYDPISLSYKTKRLDQEQLLINDRRSECNKIFMEIKREYDNHVFENEICFYELYNKIQDIEDLFGYLYKK